MKKKSKDSKSGKGPKSKTTKTRTRRKKSFPGYPLYPQKEDIYNNEKKITNLNMDDGHVEKEEDIDPDEKNEVDPEEIFTGDDLDIPGGELDDLMEDNGDEDEENNYYSLGGDNHDL
jgi:hypothetical protein